VTIRNRYQEQRSAIRELESLPSDPIELIDYVADAIGIRLSTQELANLLIRKARITDYPVEKDAKLWGLAALRRAGELTDGHISLKTLSQYTDESSNEISTRAQKLRSVLNQIDLEKFRYEHMN
jgi:transcription initiation factor TFIIB